MRSNLHHCLSLLSCAVGVLALTIGTLSLTGTAWADEPLDQFCAGCDDWGDINFPCETGVQCPTAPFGFPCASCRCKVDIDDNMGCDW
jgi:hypothetical protein